MATEDTVDGGPTYTVVMNHEEQYSIWLKHKPVPAGWTEVGKVGSREECLAYIGEVWTDMRPRSIRERDEAGAG
jgi:MbtH protein